MILAYIISNSKEEAERISVDLLEKKLVYSINMFPGISSMHWRDDEIVSEERIIVLAKTKALLYKLVEDEVKRVRTSGTTIVFSMPITQMSQDLFDNIQASTLKV